MKLCHSWPVTCCRLLARAYPVIQVDDVLPPACVSRWAANAPDGSSLAALRARCEQHLGARHAAERLLRCWGNAGAGVSYAETKERISKVCVCVWVVCK